MGKIQVEKLAQMMGTDKQDLIFKLKSIGVRVEGDDAHIDTNVLQAILQGKKLPQPREVILRDEEATTTAAPVRRPAPTRRMPPPPTPSRPGRRRTMIHRVESRIRTLPATKKPEEEAPVVPAETPAPVETAPEVVSTTPAVEAAPAASAPAAPAKPTKASRPAAAGPSGPSRKERRAERKKDTPARMPANRQAAPLSFKANPPETPVLLTEGLTVREFAEKLGLRVKDLMQVLFGRGVLATINQILPAELALSIAEQLEVDAMEASFEEEIQLRQEAQPEQTGTAERAPVVTIMGHVDHGKTTLLDTIRKSKVTEQEFGGITQHIGAYEVSVKDKRIVFLDTPGHEAFTLMRARGAKVTDIVILVVAADDGVMPQTKEAIDHAKAAGVPIIVAVNKIDRPNANPDKLKGELAEHGLSPEDWGGDTVCVPVSALQNEGIDELLDMVLLTAELAELKASPELPAQGAVIEARKELGRGIVATVLVQDGSLRIGDVFVSGPTWGRVRAMVNDRNEKLKVAGPSTPVEVTGLGELPGAGDLFQVVEEESKARSISEFRKTEARERSLSPIQAKVSLDQLFAQLKEGETRELPIVLRADVRGSLEVLSDTLQKLSTDQVRLKIIHAGVGGITTDNVLLASASDAVVVGFNVRPERKAADLADKEEVDIRLHTVIYEVLDEMKAAMGGLLEPTFKEVERGRAEVREMFKVPKIGSVAGCHVVEGVIPRNASVRLVRDSVVVYEGKISSLRRFKDDTSEVRTGFDCGIGLEKYQDIKPGDSIEAYEFEEVQPTL